MTFVWSNILLLIFLAAGNCTIFAGQTASSQTASPLVCDEKDESKKDDAEACSINQDGTEVKTSPKDQSLRWSLDTDSSTCGWRPGDRFRVHYHGNKGAQRKQDVPAASEFTCIFKDDCGELTPRPQVIIPPPIIEETGITYYCNEYDTVCEYLGSLHSSVHTSDLNSYTHLQLLTELKVYALFGLIYSLQTTYTSCHWYGNAITYADGVITRNLVRVITFVDAELTDISSDKKKLASMAHGDIPKERYAMYARYMFEVLATMVLHTGFRMYAPAENLIYNSFAMAYQWEENSFEDLPLCLCTLVVMLQALCMQTQCLLSSNRAFLSYNVLTNHGNLGIARGDEIFPLIMSYRDSKEMSNFKIINDFLVKLYKLYGLS